jgi:hypothetical protein
VGTRTAGPPPAPGLETTTLAAPARPEPMIKKIKPGQQYHSILCFEGLLTCLEGPYLIAATRFVDYVTLHIVSGLIPDIIEEIGEFFLDRKLDMLIDTNEFPSRPGPARPVPSRLSTTLAYNFFFWKGLPQPLTHLTKVLISSSPL